MKIAIPLKNLAIAAFFFLSSCSVVNETCSQKENSAYFVSVPITEFSASQIPCINIEMEDKTLLATLDLGFRGHVSMPPDKVEGIVFKTLLGEKTMYGIRGKAYKKKLYRIPEIKISSMIFPFPNLQEDHPEFHKDATFIENETTLPSPQEPGRVGWELFRHTCLFIDIQNKKITFCDGLETLKKEGYAIEMFVKTPLFLERGLVEFDCFTPKGRLRCMLDTGATWNVLNEETGDIDIDKALWTPGNVVEHPFCQIEDTDFGPIAFHRMSYQISEITLGLATSALQQIFRLHSCLAMLAMVTRSRQKICAASLPNLTLFLIFGINPDSYPNRGDLGNGIH